MRSDAPVCIVGAGPVGLATAARLASFGIRSVVLEANPALVRAGSKACLIQGDVLEVLDKVGCGAQVHEEGVVWDVARTYVRNREVLTTHYPERPGFGPFINISQYRIEQVLLARVQADPLCEVRWSHAVTDVEQAEDGAVVHADTPAGPARVRCDWVVACDGVRSRMRDIVGVEWTGYTHDAKFLITDIRAELPLPKERHFHFDPSFNPGRQVVMHPQPNEIWRIDWQLAPGADIAEERRTGAFEARVHAVIGDVPFEVDWLSTYRFHQRVVDRFVVGRVLFAGDAAHALPPYGARGMNSGIQDADNLAWKLASVLHGWSSEDLVESYHDERYAATAENLAITEATIRFMVPPSPLRRYGRATVLALSRPFRFMRGRVNSGTMAEPFVYRDSPIVEPVGGHPLVGQLAPDAVVPAPEGRIRSLFGAEHVVLAFAGNEVSARRLADAWAAQAPAAPVRLVLVVAAEAELGQLPDGVALLHDAGGELRATYRAERPQCLLVRPDGHVAAAVGVDAEQIAATVARCTRAVASRDDARTAVAGVR
jgi:3-(3-hydroxy-phenyl)propionate hydroxylase